MNLVNRSRRLAAAIGAAALLMTALPAAAQEIADSHLAAARSAITAMRATNEFDNILPQAALGLKNELIQQNPNLQGDVNAIVDETALSLASRRGDLEREVALIYARAFTEPELQELAAFYATETGKKVMETAPLMVREIRQSADIWGRGIARDMAQQVAEKLQERVGFNPLENPEGEATPAPASE
ncbi:DUF2059 domain-containing protein [Mesorhizobium microcysteis]|uniref:DUF2059 domain-containing protein n=2 Tax=Neoaquamicrobium microcysteis TaxID=2682781 RepID=A0A5D4H4J1_9HYPH|nr:DUF2059 domain-containing protein [Mesorhizobium microcysteis]